MTPYRSLSLLLALLTVVACGPEAPARAGLPARADQASTPLLQAERPTLPTPKTPDLRTMGDPNAPIVVIEYGDYQ